MSNRVRILAVDDSVTIRKALELILAPAGFELAFATSGADALEQARALLPGLVLLDFILPDMRGSDVCRALRDDPLTAEVPVVLISARGAEIRQAYQDAPNVVRYLTKPFTPEEVIGVVTEVTGAPMAPAEMPAVAPPPIEPPAVVIPATIPAPAAAAPASPAAAVTPVGLADDEEAEVETEGGPVHAPRPGRETLEAMFETLRAGLEGVFVEEADTPAGAAADQAKSFTELASHLSAQLAEALRQAESGRRYALCSDGSVRSLGETLLDSYRRVCRLLFRATAAAVVTDDGAEARPRVLVACHRDSPASEALAHATRDNADWLTVHIDSDFRQLPHTVRLFGPTHMVVDAGLGAVREQLRLIRAMPEARRMQIVGVAAVGDDGGGDAERLAELGVGAVLESGADFAAALRARVQTYRDASM